MHASAANGGAGITNGTVTRRVTDEGRLNVAGDTPSLGETSIVGLRYNATGTESSTPGCLCEGRGVGQSLDISGYANVSTDGVQNLRLFSFTSIAAMATSIVRVGSVPEVIHAYRPSPTDKLYQVDVAPKNISGVDFSSGGRVYRRVMD